MTTITLSSPTTNDTMVTACPSWCDGIHDTDDTPHGGGVMDVELSMADPARVDTPDGPTTLPTFVSAELWQAADSDIPTISLVFGPAAELVDFELPALTVDEAERLADALLQLTRRAKIG